MSVKTYKLLCKTDRLQIYELLFEGLNLQVIIRQIGLHKSTIYQRSSRAAGIDT